MTTATTATVEVRTIPANWSQIASEWDPNAFSAPDYSSSRAKALYSALDVDPNDEEYSLARSRDGRWALIGLTVTGHRYAVEVGP